MSDKEKLDFIFNFFGIYQDEKGWSVDSSGEPYECDDLEDALKTVLMRERYSFACEMKEIATR